MEPLRNLIYFSCVSKGAVILARHRDLGGEEELEDVAVECLGKIPPFHSRFTHATRSRRFCFLMDPPFVYCAIVDEALAKPKAFAFLEQVRDDFKRMLKSKGFLSSNREENLQGCGLDDEFAPVFRRLVNPFVGVPRAEAKGTEEEARANREEENEAEPEVSSPTASVPLYEKSHGDSKAKKDKKSFCPLSPLLPKTNKHEKKKVRDQVSEVKEIIMENSGKALDKGQKLEVMVDGSHGGGPALQLQRSVSVRNKGQQLAQRMWWRNVKVVLLLDLVICLVLFGVWLCICHGFQCIS